MRSPGVIYRQYRLLKHNRLKKEIEKQTKRCPQNCYYWRELTLPDEKGKEYKIPMCFLRQEEGKPLNPKHLAICSTIENAQRCNAFSLKHKKEDIEKKFLEELTNPHTKFEKFPELATFEWVLDKSLYEAKQNPGFFSKFIIYCIMVLEDFLKKLNGPEKKLEESVE